MHSCGGQNTGKRYKRESLSVKAYKSWHCTDHKREIRHRKWRLSLSTSSRWILKCNRRSDFYLCLSLLCHQSICLSSWVQMNGFIQGEGGCSFIRPRVLHVYCVNSNVFHPDPLPLVSCWCSPVSNFPRSFQRTQRWDNPVQTNCSVL